MSTLKRCWRNDYFKTVVVVALIIAVIAGLIIGMAVALNTPYPALTVESGSMSIPYDGNDNLLLSLEHPFSRTLSIGDIIIVEGVNPKDLKTDYPNSDIIVYHDPDDPSMLIVHRIVSEETINGTMYFQTKGDGNPPEYWPNPATAVDPWGPIPQNDIVGKVILRIPWLGWVTLFMRDNPWGLPAVVTIIFLLVVVEFVVPILREKRPEQQNNTKCEPQMSL